MTKEQIFIRLWNDYTTRNPQVKQIFDLFTSKGETVLNDHIAFRTFNLPEINVKKLSKTFVNAGYAEKQSYIFEEKKLSATHYEVNNFPEAPKVFISELQVEKFSPFLQQTVHDIVKQIPENILNSNELLFAGASWPTPSFETYNKLRTESEYAAWLYVHGFRANHFTVNINALKTYNTIEKVNTLLKENGFKLNTSGGEIKGTKEELLQQSSTLADIIKVQFKEGVFEIPSCYYEFAIRYHDSNGQLYSGFIAKSADKIFESTNFYKQS